VKTKSVDTTRWQSLARQFLGEDFFDEIMETAKGHDPRADVYHGPGEVIVVVDLPGIENVRSLKMRVEDETLVIHGTFPTPYDGYEVRVSERKKGEFEKVIPLGARVTTRRASARFRKGVLELRFPKRAAQTSSGKIRMNL
jgi:HSP20 family protein